MHNFKHECRSEHASKFWDWIKNRGGVAIWKSVDLSDPSKSWSTPALTDGKETSKPHWQADSKPSQVITNPEEIGVFLPKEVKRFRVAVRMAANGLKLKLSDAATRKLNKALEKAGEDAFYEFDYETQEAVIYVTGEQVSLSSFIGKTFN